MSLECLQVHEPILYVLCKNLNAWAHDLKSVNNFSFITINVYCLTCALHLFCKR